VIGPLPYIGGKRRLAKRLLPLIPQHLAYVEPFAGGAQVFFHKPRSELEVLNDLDGEVVNFLRICQRHPQELARLLRFQPASRRLFEQHQAPLPGDATDIERAVRFFYLQKNAWSGRRHRQNFRVAAMARANYSPASLPKRLTEVADRLAEVHLENLPYEEVLARYDRPTTFFYCDPPYVGVDLYQHNFTDAQFEQLAERLAALHGTFLLSLNDCPKARVWFGGFQHLEVTFTYTAMRTPRPFRELVFANFPLPATLPAP